MLITRDAHYGQLEKSGRKRKDSEKLPPFPIEAAHIWRWFNEIRALGGDYSPSSMKAYFELNQLQPSREELQALMKLAQVAMRSVQ